jgi:hypothetical protein
MPKRLLIALTAAVIAVAFAPPARADDQRVHLRGTITAVDHDTISVALATGPVTILLTPATRIAYVVKSDFSAIKPGMAVGSAAVMGTDGMLHAREVHIFPAGSTPNLGVSAWDSEPGASMTNALVTTIADAKVDAKSATAGGHVLTLTPPGAAATTIVVGPTTPIVTSAPADRTALVAGAHVIVYAVKHDDGSLTVGSINVGQNGLTPPM